MTGHAFSARTKALTIVPLALLCGAWTVSLVSTSAGASDDHPQKLPDGSSALTKAIEAPASMAQPGVIAPGVPPGTADQVVASASSSGIPSAALAAYQRGAQIIDAADKSCNIPWELIAAIGRVESNHGRYGGNTLNDQGVATPGIFGISLNGKNNTQRINDTDGGQLDKDPVFDRAVGPMQFIPSTWTVVKVDADGDGVRNPQDIDDAALATAVYLCSGSENLSERKGQETAVFRYNHSYDYVNLVLRLMQAYQQGEYTAIPTGSYGGSVFSPSYAATAGGRGSKPGKHSAKAKGTASGPAGSTTGKGTKGSVTVPTSGPTSGSNPLPDPPKAPGGGDLGGIVSDAPDAVKSVAQPTVDTLSSLSEAVSFCADQLSGLTSNTQMIDKCAAKVLGKTKDQAAAAIPNTLGAVLTWLGLPKLF